MAPTQVRRVSRLLVSGIALMLGFLVVLPAETQDLAALARKEKERRAKLQKKAPTYTEGSAKEGEAGSKPGSVTKLSEVSPGAEPNQPPPASVGDPEAQRAEWKAKAVAARAAVEREAQVLASMEREISTYRSDQTPLTAQEAQDPMRLQKREARIAEMAKKIDVQKEVLANARKGVEALEAEARRSGIPAGWLR